MDDDNDDGEDHDDDDDEDEDDDDDDDGDGLGYHYPGQDSTQEEAQPIHHQEKCKAQGSFSEQEAVP